jgi:hypothetical protein
VRNIHAHAGLVGTLEWFRDDLAALGRWETAQQLRSLSARMARSAPRCPSTEAAIVALGEAVRELARPRPDVNRLVTFLVQAAEAAGHLPGALESLKSIIAGTARPPPSPPRD